MENSPVPTNKPTFTSIPLHSTNTIVAPSECRQGPGLLLDEPPQPGCGGLGRFSRVQLTAPTRRRCKPRGIAWGLDDADGWDVPFAPTRLHYGMPSCCRFRVVVSSLPCCRTGIFSGEPPKVEFVHLKTSPAGTVGGRQPLAREPGEHKGVGLRGHPPLATTPVMAAHHYHPSTVLVSKMLG